MKTIRFPPLLVIAGFLAAAAAMPEEQTTGNEFPIAARPVQSVVLRANTLIPLRLTESVGSDSHQSGARFRLVVTDDIHVDDLLVIPAGSVVEGEVIHAAKSGMFGKPGELSITSRLVLVGERRIKLRSLFAKAGKTNADLAFGVGMVLPLAPFFIKGKQVIVPAGTELLARVAADEVFESTSSAVP
jgi:hypothetical protein